MARAKRAHIHSIDQTWMRWRQCDWCGGGFCVNNYADRKSRVPRYKGRIICQFCRSTFSKSKPLKKLMKLVEETAAAPCLRWGKKKCKCPHCKARRWLEEP